MKIKLSVIIVIRNGRIVWKHGPCTWKSLWYLEIYQTRGSILRNMTGSEGDHALARVLHAILDKIGADILKIAKKWN